MSAAAAPIQLTPGCEQDKMKTGVPGAERWNCWCGAPGATLKVTSGLGEGGMSVFHCSACGDAGDTLDLVARLHFGGDRQAAYDSIAEDLQRKRDAEAMAEWMNDRRDEVAEWAQCGHPYWYNTLQHSGGEKYRCIDCNQKAD